MWYFLFIKELLRLIFQEQPKFHTQLKFIFQQQSKLLSIYPIYTAFFILLGNQ